MGFYVKFGAFSGELLPTPTLPADAVEFNSANAIDGADAAMESGNSLGAVAKGTTLAFTVQDAIDLVTDQVISRANNSQSIATGVTTTTNCLFSGTQTETGNQTASGGTGTIAFSDCNEDGISLINGSISFILTLNGPIFDFDIGGNLTFTLVSDGTVITMVMNLSETIDTNTFAFSISQTFSVSGVPIGISTVGGFLVTTPTPFSGDLTGVDTGQMLIQGANGTQVRITVTSLNTATVEVDDGTGGGFVILDMNYAI